MARTSRFTSIAALLGATLAISGAGVGTASAAGICAGLEALLLADGSTLCTHGNDDHLLTLDEVLADTTAVVEQVAAQTTTDLLGNVVTVPTTPVTQNKTAAANNTATRNKVDGAVPALPPTCMGNGTDGQRVELLAIDVTGSEIAPAADADLRRWAGQVTWTYEASAQRDGADRHVRWTTQATDKGCNVAITRLSLAAADVDGFQATIAALGKLGFDRKDRKYLAFVNVSDGICGIGTVPIDDRAGEANSSNHTTGYSRIDAPCWGTGDAGFYSVAAHELTHNLGGVQNTAPNASGGYHCTDQWDLMCYADGNNDVSLVCVDDNDATAGDGDHNNRLLDCNTDDYFNASSQVRGHLATHWNVADSIFLWDGTKVQQPAPTQAEEEAEAAPQERTAAAVTEVSDRNSTVVGELIDWVLDLFRLLSGEGLLTA